MKPSIAEAMDGDLGWACLLLHAWIQIAALDDGGTAGSAADANFEQFTLPAAVLDPATTLRENAEWRRLFPDGPPAWARAAVQAVCAGDTMQPCLQPIAMADSDMVLATAAMALPEASNVALVVCAEPTHDVMARALQYKVERDELLDRLRNAQEDAELAHRIKDQILAGVSHELRAPVTTMMLWERVLRDPMADDTTRLQALDAIHQSAVAQSRIVGDLLDVSRAISGKLYIDFRWVDLGRVVGAAVEAALPAALAKRISLTHEGPAFTGDITGDASRLRQVIDNLLSNAIKFTDPGGRISVTLERTGRLIVIIVADTGRGISPAVLNRIFEPFDQGESIMARREGGLGLGLTIAKEIVELHHGTLTASSKGEGYGSQFTLTLPSAGQTRAPSPPAGVVPQLSLKGIRVLVIDDDERVCAALALLLTRAGAIVDRASSASAARKRMARREPHVIICDIAMPHEDGYEFIRTLRASGDQIPAIALTGHATRADAEQAVAAGFDLHVAKPVDIERLVATLIRVIESRRRDAD